MRRLIYVLAVLLIALPIAAVADVATISGPVVVRGVLHYEYNATLSIDAGGEGVVNVSAPQGLTPEAIYVVVTNCSGNAELEALDANGSKLVSATIVPLSSGYMLTLPPETAAVRILSSSVWQGTITVIVESAVEFEVQMPSEIRISGGSGEATAHIEQKSGPAGKIYLVDSSQKIDVRFRDPEPEYDGDMVVETSGAGWSADVPVVVTAGGEPGTYSVQVRMMFETTSGMKAEVGVWSMSVSIDGDGGAVKIDAGSVDYKSIGIGVAAAFILLFILLPRGRGKRHAMVQGAAVFILLLFAAGLALAAGFIDVDAKLDVDPRMIGIGMLAMLLLLLLARHRYIPVPSRVEKLLR